MVTQEQFVNGFVKYLDNELMPKIHLDSWKQWAIGTGLSIVVKRIGNVISSMSSNEIVCVLGVFDSQGNIDIDILAEESKKHIPTEGIQVSIPILGTITFHAPDVDLLYKYITGV